MHCPLCLQNHSAHFEKDRLRDYFKCQVCQLVFVPPDQLPTPSEEEERYRLHQTHDDDEGYLVFVQSFMEQLKQRVVKAEKGLDYGSGPTPLFSSTLRKEGYSLAIYDPFFANDRKLLTDRYDYITCVETVEHFHHPRAEWEQFKKLTKPEGWIAVKTSLLHDQIEFKSWYYKGDITHVCFYTKETFEWIGRTFGFRPEFEGASSIFLRHLGG